MSHPQFSGLQLPEKQPVPAKSLPFPINSSNSSPIVDTHCRKEGVEYAKVNYEEEPWLHSENIRIVYGIKQATQAQVQPAWDLLYGDSRPIQPRSILTLEDAYCYSISRKAERVVGPRLPPVFADYRIDNDGNLILGNCLYHRQSKNCPFRNTKIKPDWNATADQEDRPCLLHTLIKFECSLLKPREYCAVEEWADSEAKLVSGKRARPSTTITDDTTDEDLPGENGDGGKAKQKRARKSATRSASFTSQRASSTATSAHRAPTSSSSATLVGSNSSSQSGLQALLEATRAADSAGTISSTARPPSSTNGTAAIDPLSSPMASPSSPRKSASFSTVGETSSQLATLRLHPFSQGKAATQTSQATAEAIDAKKNRKVDRLKMENKALRKELENQKTWRKMYEDQRDEYNQLETDLEEAEASKSEAEGAYTELEGEHTTLQELVDKLQGELEKLTSAAAQNVADKLELKDLKNALEVQRKRAEEAEKQAQESSNSLMRERKKHQSFLGSLKDLMGPERLAAD